MHDNYQAGYSLVATLISITIGIILCSCALHFIYMTVNTYNKIQQRFSNQNARLMARQFLGADLLKQSQEVSVCKAGTEICKHLITPSIQKLIEQKQIKIGSDLLILHGETEAVIYYLRKSSIQKNASNSFALYRDDIEHNALALIEDVQDFKVQLNNIETLPAKIKILLTFNNGRILELVCTLPH